MNGLTKLDVFALHILQALLGIDNIVTNERKIEKAYDLAEKMLAESEKRNKTDKPKREIPEIDKNDLTDLTR